MHRLDGDEYFKVIDEFMEAVRIRFPNALVQFEDLTSDKVSPVCLHFFFLPVWGGLGCLGCLLSCLDIHIINLWMVLS